MTTSAFTAAREQGRRCMPLSFTDPLHLSNIRPAKNEGQRFSSGNDFHIRNTTSNTPMTCPPSTPPSRSDLCASSLSEKYACENTLSLPLSSYPDFHLHTFSRPCASDAAVSHALVHLDNRIRAWTQSLLKR